MVQPRPDPPSPPSPKTPATLTVSPVLTALGNVGPPFKLFTLIARNVGQFGNITISAIAFNNTDYTGPIAVPLPIVLAPGASFAIGFQITPTVTGPDNCIISFTSNNPNGIVTVQVTATSLVAAGGIVAVVPNLVGAVLGDCGTVKLKNIGGQCAIFIQNIGTAPFQVTNMILNGALGNFTFANLPIFPFTINPGNQAGPFGINFIPQQLGALSCDLQVLTNLAAPQNLVHVNVFGVGVLLIPVAILTGIPTTITFAYGSGAIESMVFGDLNCGESGEMDFNGVLWGSPDEKSFMRMEVLYENLGVAILTLNVKVLRPSTGPDAFDLETSTITIGTALADGTLRSAFFDVINSGEIMLVSITRAGGDGPLSIAGFIPRFELKGEKVEGI